MIAVCLKWSVGSADERFIELSFADQAALELALTTAERTGDQVRAVTAGPPEADKILRHALSVGVHHVLRIDSDPDTESADVARLLGDHLRDCQLIWCGDYSSDRGSGSVPAFLAAELDMAQGLGLISVDIPERAGDPLVARRRLDGGRREVLDVSGRAVLSVEGSAARLRRASLRQTMDAQRAEISVVQPTRTPSSWTGALRAFSPRARVVPPPRGDSALDRVRLITDTSTTKGHGETIELDPRAAAERIVAALRSWGYSDS